jgi:Ca2+-binding RTX toxin-like protein
VKGTQKITLKNIEKVQFSDGTKSLAELYANIASAANDTLTGTDGNDHMNGLAGADQLAGGKGNDTYFIDNAGDTVIELAGEGTDTVDIAITAKGTYTLGPHVENATITSTAAINVIGNAEDNTLTGNAAANALTGGDGNDILIGGKGNDTLDGGAGDDFYAVDAAGDKVIEAQDGGYDIVETTLAKYTLAANVEELRFTGKGAFTGIGNALDNVIIGGTGNDKLTGGGGADTFVIGTGNDTVTDFARGVDTLVINRTIGNGDNAIDGAVTLSSAGGFSSDAELVIFTQKVASLTVANAAKAIGSATEAYAKGDTALFALHDAKSTALYLFTSSGSDAVVGAGELVQVATLTGVQAASAADFALA